MNFLHREVNLSPGMLVRVTLDHAANVFLVDNVNFNNYRHGRKYTYYGGHATQSPVFLRPPRPGHWNVVVDLGGFAGRVTASVDVISG
ncbi:DUF1883 domain-containing protein [Leptospira alstonii]|uniref:DUF1883 domain-containing protein n=1 Tax=Leptospira alstonii TaxID=28452 RepID=UPI0009E6A948|nr:DUF1883 domain-containing protein [Leptospira alstonii]